jgi:hypothetical protein
VAKLTAAYRAIPQWESLALAEVGAQETTDTPAMSEEQQHWHAEYINDQYFILDETMNCLYAGLAVSVASTIENTMAMLCEELKVSLPTRAQWGHKRTGLEDVLKSGLDELPAWDVATRARLLANCFKHNSGKMNPEWICHFGGSSDEDIRYAHQEWNAIIDGVRRFLGALVDSLASSC